ncbi:MAG: aromatic amino acid hydroxylase [Balneolaceae bacterium]|nr:MAG: aromatic amino acid hydroxylase [Balneolaceae bacterium]
MSMQLTQEEVIQSIPSYLRQFVVKQHYDEYTPQHHATWRYIMRRNVNFLKKYAHPAYLDGLEKTGISIDTIPHIDDMNDKLGKIGWRAVVVDGFVPPAAFMEYSEHKILVISAEMRNIGNILYTPAPDIVHEAAGHAPIIADPLYSEYLQRFGKYGAKAVFSKDDYDIYEAIRYLSIIKEYANATEQQISEAERDLEQKLSDYTVPSEAAELSRMHWWTVEYGLVGSVDDFRLFGAGLLSSVGESKACLSPEVKKIPFSTDCVNYNYDITKMQPQLFVAEDFQHLIDVLEEYADGMCFRKGGADSVRRVIDSLNVGTAVFSSGLQVSGQFNNLLTDGRGHEIYVGTTGPSQLSYEDTELEGHGTDYHKDGFSSPVGRIMDSPKPLEKWTDSDLADAGLLNGRDGTLAFESGVVVAGQLRNVTRRAENLLLMTFENCTVTGPDGTILFHPDWGVYDMAVGGSITSVWSGSADKEKFNVYPPKSTKTTIKDEPTASELRLYNLYSKVRNMRDTGTANDETCREVVRLLNEEYPKEWLLRLELLELIRKNGIDGGLEKQLDTALQALKNHSDVYDNVITAGYEFMLK